MIFMYLLTLPLLALARRVRRSKRPALGYLGLITLFSLAATLYHLATGRVLFPGLDSEEMMRAHCAAKTQAKDPRVYRPELSEGFCQMLEAMLVKDRDGRPSLWSDVLAMCQEVEGGVAFKPRRTPGVSSVALAPSRV